MNDTERLLPCPFCGGEAKIIPYGYADGFIIEHQTRYDKITPLCPVGNDEGKGIGIIYYETKREAIHAWNKRVYLGQPKTGEWIPCRERLPEEPEKIPEDDEELEQMYLEGKIKEYIVTIQDSSVSTTLHYIGKGEWIDILTMECYEVAAWKGLPEAYRDWI